MQFQSIRKLNVLSTAIFALVVPAVAFADHKSPASPSVAECTWELVDPTKILKMLPKWMRTDLRAPSVHRLLVELLHLKASDKAALLETLESSDAYDAPTKKLIKLFLHEEGAWTEFLDQALETGMSPRFLGAAFFHAIERMPEALAKKLADRVVRDYAKASKDAKSGLIAPKRAFDLFLRFYLKPEKIIAEGFARTGSALDAYKAYFNRIHELFSGGSRRSEYTADDVLAAARAAQEWLGQRFGDFRFNEAEVRFAGSFPAGKADLQKSDLDVMLSYDDMYAATLPGRAVAPLSVLIKNVNAAIKADLSIGISSFNEERTLMLANPIQLKITPNEVVLRVFRFSINADHLDKNAQKVDEYRF